jgi:hypothetical protein
MVRPSARSTDIDSSTNRTAKTLAPALGVEGIPGIEQLLLMLLDQA